jgi:hypothetical protein
MYRTGSAWHPYPQDITLEVVAELPKNQAEHHNKKMAISKGKWAPASIMAASGNIQHSPAPVLLD